MIHEQATLRALGFVRVWVFGLWVVYLFADRPADLAALPGFDPVGPWRLFAGSEWSWLRSPGFLTAFQWLLLGLLGACLAGARPYRLLALAAALGLTFYQALGRSFFYVNHQELSALYAVYVLAVFPADRGFRWRPEPGEDAPHPQARAALLLMTGLLLAPYWLIGSYRLAVAGPELFFGGAVPLWFADNTYGPTWYGVTISEHVLVYPWLVRLLELGFLGITICELLAPLCLISRRFRLAWLAAVVPFHLLSAPLMDILFWENLALMAVLLTDVSSWSRRPDDRGLTRPGVEVSGPGD